MTKTQMTKTTFGQQAAAAARKRDHANAAALYSMAALEAERDGNEARAKKHRAKQSHFERMMDRDYP